MSEGKKKIIIVDDVELNRVILKEAFSKEYDILEAENGYEGLEKITQNRSEMAAIFLDIIMPEMDGFSVLQELDYAGIIKEIPLFLITTETTDYVVEKAYDYGAVDVIQKPFNLLIIERRVKNILELFQKRKHLEALYNQQKAAIGDINLNAHENGWNVAAALSTAIKSRAGCASSQTSRIHNITAYIAKMMSLKHPEYSLTDEKIRAIAQAAIIYDCGKIAIPDAILAKPAAKGRLTPEEFEKVKNHTVEGFNLVKRISGMNEPFKTYALEICRSHHERWDGGGYPDALKGSEIPMSAQIVSIVDVFDALVSPRIYKNVLSKEDALKMINDGECGAFNPDLLECFNSIADEIYEKFYK